LTPGEAAVSTTEPEQAAATPAFDQEASRARAAALDEVAAQVRACTKCRLHAGRTNAVPGEGHPDTEVMFVGEGPGFNEDRQGRPFVGRAGELLVRLLGEVGWRREEVFITNVVKCRPPDNRDPEPDEIAACAPYLQRQLEILQPSLVVTLGRHSLGRFMPGSRIGQVHGTYREAAEGTAPAGVHAYAMYHPAAALRTPEIERQSVDDIRGVPAALTRARSQRHSAITRQQEPESPDIVREPLPAAPDDVSSPGPDDLLASNPALLTDPTDQLGLF
jgi:uracil-DNA glycosylase family 4